MHAGFSFRSKNHRAFICFHTLPNIDIVYSAHSSPSLVLWQKYQFQMPGVTISGHNKSTQSCMSHLNISIVRPVATCSILPGEQRGLQYNVRGHLSFFYTTPNPFQTKVRSTESAVLYYNAKLTLGIKPMALDPQRSKVKMLHQIPILSTMLMYKCILCTVMKLEPHALFPYSTVLREQIFSSNFPPVYNSSSGVFHNISFYPEHSIRATMFHTFLFGRLCCWI